MFTACGIMHRRRCLLVTLSPAGSPKHVKLIEFTNNLLLLHLVGCLYYYIRDAWSHKHKIYNYLYKETNILGSFLRIKRLQSHLHDSHLSLIRVYQAQTTFRYSTKGTAGTIGTTFQTIRTV